MKKEQYERMQLTITAFDTEDVITTSNAYAQDKYETPGVYDATAW